MKNFPLVSIISVNYAQAEVTCAMIASFQSVTYPNYEIIVVDNASKEDPLQIIEKYPEVNLIRSEKNIGFAEANNIGIIAAKGTYILFLNNDTEVDAGFLEPMVEAMQNNPRLGGVSPKVLYYNTQVIQYAGASRLNSYTGRAFSLNYREEDRGQVDMIKPTYYMMGTAMMLSKKVIEEVGLMPEIYFMYYEEIEWSEKIWKSAYEINYIGKSKVFHKDSVSIGVDSLLKTFYINRNRILFLRRNSSVLQLLISFLFFLLLSIPKNILTFVIKGKFVHLAYYLKALFWHLTHFDVRG